MTNDFTSNLFTKAQANHIAEAFTRVTQLEGYMSMSCEDVLDVLQDMILNGFDDVEE